MSYLKELQLKIEGLEDVIDGQDLQARFLENELIDITSSSKAISETTMLLLGMLAELNQHVVKKGKHTDASIAAKKRLLRLFELNRQLDDISSKNYQLKMINTDLHTNYQLMRVKNKDLKQKLENIKQAENF